MLLLQRIERAGGVHLSLMEGYARRCVYAWGSALKLLRLVQETVRSSGQAISGPRDLIELLHRTTACGKRGLIGAMSNLGAYHANSCEWCGGGPPTAGLTKGTSSETFAPRAGGGASRTVGFKEMTQSTAHGCEQKEKATKTKQIEVNDNTTASHFPGGARVGDSATFAVTCFWRNRAVPYARLSTSRGSSTRRILHPRKVWRSENRSKWDQNVRLTASPKLSDDEATPTDDGATVLSSWSRSSDYSCARS